MPEKQTNYDWLEELDKCESRDLPMEPEREILLELANSYAVKRIYESELDGANELREAIFI